MELPFRRFRLLTLPISWLNLLCFSSQKVHLSHNGGYYSTNVCVRASDSDGANSDGGMALLERSRANDGCESVAGMVES